MTYFTTTFTVTILSQDTTLDGMDFDDIMHEADEGEFVAHIREGETREITGKDMADALTAAGSQPEFFQLDADGNSVED